MAAVMGMTGFGRSSGSASGMVWSWEVRSVNGRGLELRLRLPSGYDRLDIPARDKLKKALSRGNVQASLTLKSEAGAMPAGLNSERINGLLDAASPWLANGSIAAPRLDGLLAVDGVLEGQAERSESEQAVLDKACVDGLGEAIDSLLEARAVEGQAMAALLAGHVDEIERLTGEAASNDSVRLEAIRDRLAVKFEELVDGGIDPERLATEAAVMAVKMDVREELDRLRAHIEAARELLAKGSPVGRKLDFLSQEFNREANTLCSKSSDSSLTQTGLALKNTIDQFREQIQNVE
ncbi:YicC/YloC family endoribonuclease [Maricaulis sp.]|uniref:YicC/YloC family endoribonuclease n=1 Tax=Maricaulis sp. TaxID=1486257 RepID=UPI00260DFF8C|nr:YicC/YloC family endoribonuclease [Maricaulis sp.]